MRLWGKTKMTLKVFFKDLIKLTVTSEDLLPVENVLLHIRMRGLKKATRTDRRKTVFLAFPVVWLMNLILFPFTVLGYPKSFVVSLAGAFIPYYVFEFITQAEFFMLSLFFWALINYKPVYITVSKFCFDLLDFLSFGSLTELAVYTYSILPKSKHMEFLTHKNYFLWDHFFASRQIWGSSTYEQSWEAYFGKIATTAMKDEGLLKFEVGKYWENIDQPNNLYVTRRAPSLAVPTAYIE